MEELEVVEINFSELHEEYSKLRLDAEYFKKDYVDYELKIKRKGFVKVGDVAFVTDGIHESIDFDSESDVNLISAKSPKNNYFDLTSNHHISHVQHGNNPRTSLKLNDVIVSTVGTIGNCAVVENDILPANSDRHVGIIRIVEKLKPYFLSTFLLSKFGRFQTLRESTGNVQLNLFIYKIKELLIPKVSLDFQNMIEMVCRKSFSIREKSKSDYADAENILLKEIGLLDFEPSKEAVNVKSFSESFGVSGRFDAEYYQPKYDEIEEVLKSKNSCATLSDELLKIDTGEYSPEYFHQNDKSGLVFYIRSTNIKNGLIELDENYYVESRGFNRVAKCGDILTARVGSVGIFGEVRAEMEGAVYSDNVICFRLPKAFIPCVYTLLFNSAYYYEFIDRMARGSVQQRLNQETFKDLMIPIIDYNKQKEIAELVEESFKLKKQSEHLLEVAKTAVEVAIEQNEEKAMEYINNNTALKS